MNNYNGKIKTFLTEFSGYIANVIIVIGYIILQSSGLVETGKTIYEVLVDGFLLLLMTNILRMSFFATGIQRAYASDKWEKTALKHEEKLNLVMPFINKISEFLEFDYRKRLKLERITCLRGIDYNLIFDEKGKIKDYKHPAPSLDGLNKREIKAIKKKYSFECRNIEKAKQVIVPLYMPNEVISRSKPQKRMFQASTSRKAIIVLVTGLIASVFITGFNGMFTSTGINWVAFGHAVGVSLISLAIGLTALFTGYTHISQDVRGDVIDKTHYLGQFEEWIKNGGNNE